MISARLIARKILERVDAWYYRRHRLRTLGPVLYVGVGRYRGAEVRFDDGTCLRDNDPIGRLHFNNGSIAALGEGSMHRVGFQFARLMRQSLRELARHASTDPNFRDVSVFQGLTWIPAHGEVVGFVSKPLPRTLKSWLLGAHFKLLMWAFAPADKIRARDAEPRVYWLTRASLTQNLSKLKKAS
jgi:hypothetical protein